MRAIIIHGTGGSPEGNWFPWLKRELEAHAIVTTVPRLPTGKEQSLTNWHRAVDSEVGSLGMQDILIGHSIGAAFVCRLLEETKIPVRAAFLVAGFASQLGDSRFDSFNESFLSAPFNWAEIKVSAKNFYLYSGSDDPYVPPDFGERFAVALGAKNEIVPGGGHLNQESGFTSFELLRDQILKL